MKVNAPCVICGLKRWSKNAKPICHPCRRAHPLLGPRRRYSTRQVVKCTRCGREGLSWSWGRGWCNSCANIERGFAAPCAVCGRMLAIATTSRVSPVCRPCRAEKRNADGIGERPPPVVPCIGCGTLVDRGKNVRSDLVRCVPCRRRAISEVNRRKNTARRRTKAGRFSVFDVGDRDGWRCHLCRKAVNSALSGMHPRGPTIDHLVPVSLGGEDVLSNVSLAHRECNVRRGVNRAPAQLLLAIDSVL